MADRLEDLLRACTVRVTGGPTSGAGFFVAPGKVLTCVHVIGDSTTLMVRWERDDQPAVEVPVTGLAAVLEDRGRPIPALDRDYPDIAVLDVDGGLGAHPCVGVDPEWPSLEDNFLVFGYPEEGGAMQITPARLAYRGTHGTMPAAYLDLASDMIKPGMSGAAVLNLRTGSVCGVVVASKHPARPDGALAVPWPAVAQDLDQVFAANRAFHVKDRRWGDSAVSRRARLKFRLPRVVAHFTGRDELLAQLDDALSAGSAAVTVQVITGMGGVGKTQAAAAYAQAHHDEFDIAAWVRAEDGGTADLAELAVALALPAADRTPAERADDALTFLANTDRRWLLVLDNAVGPDALAKLPSSGRGYVLVTSRHRGGYDAFGDELVVSVFDADTARRYLLARSGRPPQEAGAADAVAAALGFLPLALAHAGAYCAARTGVPFGEYLELLERLPSQDMFDTNPETFYQHTVAATWNTSIAAAARQAPLARPALEMTAYLAAEAIPRSFFLGLAEDSAAGRKQIADALAALDRYSLATVADNTVSVHRLLQKVIRDRLAGNGHADPAEHALAAVLRAMPGDPQQPATWPQWQELVPHGIALADNQPAAEHDAAKLMAILNPMCLFLLSAGFPQQSLDLATRAVAVSASHLDADDINTLTARGAQVSSLQAAGRSSDAIALGEPLVSDFERVLGPSHPDTLIAKEDLARAYLAAGRQGEALALQKQVVAGRQAIFGASHPDTLRAQSNLATAYQAAGQTDTAIAVLRRVLAERQRAPGASLRDTLATQASLALCYRDIERVDEAITILEEVVTDSEEGLGPEHPDTLSARGNLGGSYAAAGRTSEAIGLLEQLAADCIRVLGPGHPYTLTARGNLAAAYLSAGRISDALARLEEDTAVSARLRGQDHPDTLTAKVNLATLYHSMGRTDDSIALLEQVTADSDRKLGPRHPISLAARENLAEARRRVRLQTSPLGLTSEIRFRRVANPPTMP